MIYKTFDASFHRYTQSGKPNLIWGIERYFNQISIDLNFKDSTIEQEYSRFINNVIPVININIALEDYDSEEIKKLLDNILAFSEDNISQNTFEHSYRGMVSRIPIYYNNEFKKDENVFWGSFYNFDTEELNNSYLPLLTKSFTNDEERKLVEILLKNPLTCIGEEVGLSTSLVTGIRENECCGLNYSDILEFAHHKNVYKLRIFESTSLHSNVLKAGTKTDNGPRYIVLISAYVDYIFKRMKFLKSILTFPITDEKEKVYNSVLDLPIACKGTNYTQRCKSEDIAKVGKKIFKDDLRMNEIRVAKIDEDRLNAMDAGIYYKDVTLYAMRRNFDTHCYNLGFSETQIQYIMGHEIKDKRFRRCDLIDEDYLIEMYNLLEQTPINKYYYGDLTIAQ